MSEAVPNAVAKRIFDTLWADYPTSNNYPEQRPLLAHYTSVSTFEKILQGDEVWFSNPLYMNDMEELRFGMSEGAMRFRASQSLAEACTSKQIHAQLLALFDQLFTTYETDHVLDTYVLCLSEHDRGNTDGVLSMWRGYGVNGGGVAVVIDSSHFRVVPNTPLIMSKVHYASRQSRLDWIDQKIIDIARLIGEVDQTTENLNLISHHWLERLKLFSLFTKHDGFAEEREWRMVYFSERDQGRLLAEMLGYSITPRGVEPKLQLKLTDLTKLLSSNLTLDTLIDRIILGPSISSTLAATSIRRMLQLTGRTALVPKVVASSIPFRA